MPKLAVQLTISDYAKWRSKFDSAKPLRDKAGLTNLQIYRHADDAKEVLVLSETSDLAKAREALASLRIQKRHAGGGRGRPSQDSRDPVAGDEADAANVTTVNVTGRTPAPPEGNCTPDSDRLPTLCDV